jgi:hypothetical protein
MERPIIDEFLKLERRHSDFEAVRNRTKRTVMMRWRRGRPIRVIGSIFARFEERMRSAAVAFTSLP